MEKQKLSELARLIQQLKEEPIDEVMALITDTPYREAGADTAIPDDDTCPYCGHRGCFRLKLDGEKSFGKCFSCGTTGDVVSLAAELRGDGQGAAAYWLAEVLQENGTSLPERKDGQPVRRIPARKKESVPQGIAMPTERQEAILDELCRITSEALLSDKSALEYQTQVRGHAVETLRTFQVGYLVQKPSVLLARTKLQVTADELIELGLLNSKGRDLLLPGLFLYPHKDRDGRVCRLSQKDPQKKWHAQQLARGYLNGITFFGEQTLAGASASAPVAVVEGENDGLSLFEAGWKGAVLGCNGGINRRQIEWLNQHCPDRRIATFFDMDEAGEGFRRRAASGLRVAALEQYVVPEHKDIDAYLKGGGTLEALLVPENRWASDAMPFPETQSQAISLESEPQAILDSLLRAAGRDSVFDITPLDHARAILRHIGMPVVFVTEHKDWATCSPEGRWSFHQRHRVLNLFGEVGDLWRRAAQALPMPAKKSAEMSAGEKEICEQHKKCMGLAFDLGRKRGLEDHMMLASTQPAVRASFTEFDADPALLGVQNGVVDILQKAFFTPGPELLISKSCNTGYDPAARCPAWLQFLDHVAGHLPDDQKDKLLKLLQRIAGECLIFKRVRRRFFFLSGPPASGKSVFVNTLKELLGDYAVTLPTESLMASASVNHGARPDLLMMIGARMIVVSEAGDKYCFDDEKIKAITGGDVIAARALYQDQVEFVVGGNIVITGNSFPRSNTGGSAFTQRIQVVMFPNAVPVDKQDALLMVKLKDELPGILNWALEGAVESLEGVPWDLPDCVREATARYKEGADPVPLFLAECCVLGEGKVVSKRDLLAAYNGWAKENGFPNYGSNRFSTKLSDLHITETRSDGHRCYKGVQIVAKMMPQPPHWAGPDEPEEREPKAKTYIVD